jgi:ketosteroid isomerase-like protein
MIRSRLALVLSALALACDGSSPGRAALSAADLGAVRALDSAYVAAWLRDDTAGVMRTLAPDAVLMPVGRHPLTTPDEIRAFWWPSDGSHTRILGFQRTIDEIDGKGDVVWVRGRDTLSFNYDKASTHSSLRILSMTFAIVRRQPDSSWRISRMMWGTLLP